ncbi:alpha/beta hydrolase [uncultured Legionella sp.]|uniref:alpha/beta fold hydrolase n=1 Tax=uncultured Legionella sp. TaxID=210934 RepID=UPI002610BE66|nr:alpha/beta hydrolase [uncultured Legionella sp.]
MKPNRRQFLFFFITTLAFFSGSAMGSTMLIPIEHDRKIFMNCQGQGAPAVLLISGYPDRGDGSWETTLTGQQGKTVFPEVSKFTKVCDYDRPGTIKVNGDHLLESRSTSVPQPVTAEEQARDLHELVKSAQIKTPFILVAHSAGGLIARLYAYLYPNDVSGMILIDVTSEKLLDTWSPKEIEVYRFSLNIGPKELIPHYKNVEIINFDASFKQLQKYQNQKLAIPAVVLSAGVVPEASQLIKDGFWPTYVTQNMSESIINGISRAQDLVAETFVPKAKRITVKNSGHYIQKEQPNLIIDLIRAMVEQQRQDLMKK